MFVFDLLLLLDNPLIPFLAQDMTDFSLFLSLPFEMLIFDLLGLFGQPQISFLA